MPVRRGRRLALACAAATVLMSGGAAPASAGTYRVTMCETPSGRTVPTDRVGLLYTGNVWLGNECMGPNKRVGLKMQGTTLPAGPAAMPQWQANGTFAVQGGAQGVVQLIAAPNTSFVAASILRSVNFSYPVSPEPRGTPNTAMFAGTVAELNGNLLGGTWCRLNAGCAVQTRQWQNWAGRTNALFWHLGCGGPLGAGNTCASAPGGGTRAEVSLHTFDVAVADDYVPRGNGTPATGSMFDSGEVKGTHTIDVTALDDGSGVARAYVKLGDAVVASWSSQALGCTDAGELAGPDYHRLAPCPGEQELHFSVDTTRALDGTRRLEVHAVDASGGDSVIAADQVVVNNVPAPRIRQAPSIRGVPSDGLRPGDVLTATQGVWDQEVTVASWQWQRASDGGWTNIAGADQPTYTTTKDDLDRALRVVVTVTNGQELTTAESLQTTPVRSGATILGQSLGAADGSAQLVADREVRNVQVAYGARVVISGRLLDRDGQPISNAELEVLEQLGIAGAPWVRVGIVKTDAQGGYSYRPNTSGSRTLRFAYARRDGTNGFRATRDVVITVAAKMTARAVRSRVRIGGVIRLRGRVTVAPLPRSGTWVEVQVSDSGVWRTISTVRASSRGNWSFKHRLRGRERASFSFRARLRPVADVPSSESVSKPARVRVR